MRNGDNLQGGTTKKFLYSGPKKDASGEEQWIFTPRKENNPVSAPKFDMDDVWSIKKNVSANGGLLNSTDGLNLKANSTYYSRYGGIKDKNDSRFGSPNSTKSSNAQGSTSTWNSNYTSKGFSYSLNSKDNTPQATPRMGRNNNASSNNDASLW
ncbi:uncharacterized protein LOC125675880 isoform X2 [Ostrea edulis]|uniref:uncharacterized protein LOC125675880 isoform X2 n=1 Tax=Ostrea edulis TaxID=37623 RepID=UPI00209592D7|nr:uncharacterized protein LOC125675880 isoform X2 [Ostrea edulis]